MLTFFLKKRLVSLIFPTALLVSISFLPHTQLCSCAQSCPTLGDPTDCSLPGSSVYEFSQQEYWSGVPLPSPWYLPDPGIELESLISPVLTGRVFPSPGSPSFVPALILIISFFLTLSLDLSLFF